MVSKEDLQISVSQYRHNVHDRESTVCQGHFVWSIKRLPEGFNWGLLEKIPGIGGRLDHALYLYKYANLLPDNSRIVEIGAYEGGSAIAMGMGIRNTNSIIISIDPCFCSVDEKQQRSEEFSNFSEYKMSQSLGHNSVYRVLGNIRKAGLEGYISLVPDTSEEALKRWDGRKIDMLYIDGDHTHSAVKKDCEWMQHVKRGGIAVFDDWLEDVKKAVVEYVGQHPEWQLFCESTDQPRDYLWKTVYLKQ